MERLKDLLNPAVYDLMVRSGAIVETYNSLEEAVALTNDFMSGMQLMCVNGVMDAKHGTIAINLEQNQNINQTVVHELIHWVGIKVCDPTVIRMGTVEMTRPTYNEVNVEELIADWGAAIILERLGITNRHCDLRVMKSFSKLEGNVDVTAVRAAISRRLDYINRLLTSETKVA